MNKTPAPTAQTFLARFKAGGTFRVGVLGVVLLLLVAGGWQGWKVWSAGHDATAAVTEKVSSPPAAVHHTSTGARVALLIGNANYDSKPLHNPPNDVAVMARALESVGFKVTKLINANQKQMKKALSKFGEESQGAEVALLYYSGHGTQAGGDNYLLPIGADINKESDYDIEAVAANAVLRQMEGARPRAAILVLDACRDNPYAAITKSASKGLTRMNAPSGSMIAFSTAPNNTAGDEGHYARVLARQLSTPGVELFAAFRQTTAEVKRLTEGRQEPRVSEFSITDNFYLAGTVASQTASAPVAQSGAVSAPQTAAQTPPAGTVIQDCDICPPMVVIREGSFMMGSPDTEAERDKDEGTQQEVTVKKFLMGQTEITQGQWKAVMGNNPSYFKTCGDDCPVEQVSWEDIQKYIVKLNDKTGQEYRLPSEAQWEYAARAGTTTAFYTGNTITTNQANFDGNYTYNGSAKGKYREKTVKVKSFDPNGFGLYDMHGNVREWVEDVYHDNYNGAPTDGSAWVSGGNQTRRVLRGGSWFIIPGVLRSADRIQITADGSNFDTGFRLARTLLTP